MSSSGTTPSSEDKVTLNIRMLNGDPIQVIFKADAKLSVVQRWVQTKAVELGHHKLPRGKAYLEDNGIEFQTLMPKQTFYYEDFATTTLRDIGMFPRGALTVIQVGANRDLQRGKGTIAEAKKGDGKLILWIMC